MRLDNILEILAVAGLVNLEDDWSLEPASGGLNSRVYYARAGADNEARLTIRVRDRQDRSIAEVDALADVAECPAMPRIRLLTNELLVHDYVPGEPHDLRLLNDRQLQALAKSLACIHAAEYTSYTPWPETGLRLGTRFDLFRFRVASLANYDSFSAVNERPEFPALPGLIQRLSRVDLSSRTWTGADFSRIHGDLSRGNLLWQGNELGLIDWEYSRVGDPAEDLAYLFSEQEGGTELLPILLGYYVDAGGSPDVASRIPAYGIFTAVDSALWWIDHGQRLKQPVDR